MTTNLQSGKHATGGHVDDAHRAAMTLWDVLARYAWSSHGRSGRGVVLVDRTDLLSAARTDGPGPALSYVPAGMIPSGDDFAPIIARYDPRREVALLVGGADGEAEQLLVLSPAGAGRQSPSDFADEAHPPKDPTP